MKNNLLKQLKFWGVLLALSLTVNNAKAQYVTIPDTDFVAWLSSSGYANCMSGNRLDTTCSSVLNTSTMYCNLVHIHDLNGIQYFKNLDTLNCSNDSLYTIPALPASLTFLDCRFNNLNSLPALPPTLTYLECANNQLTSLPALPADLTNLDCGINQLTSLPVLPASLTFFYCLSNNLDSLPALPSDLIYLWCNSNHLISLPALPATLRILDCRNNQLNNLPTLSAAMDSLDCGNNLLNSLPALPSNFLYLDCSFNQLSNLPALPATLGTLVCSSNQITSLPALPSTLTYLDCTDNQLTSLPDLPDSMNYLSCFINLNLSCFPELKRIVILDFNLTAITCLPNYGEVSYSAPSLDTIPLCGIFNPTDCQPFWNISGRCFYAPDSSCNFDSSSVGTNYVKTQLFNGSNLVQQTFTYNEGSYSFDSVAYGNYAVQVDTSNLPFTVNCPDSDYYAVTLSAADSLSYSNNFAFKCRTEGFDIGVQSVLNIGNVARSRDTFQLNTIAGDMSELYGAHCASGISGKVQMVYSGLISYVGPAAGALTPTSVSGDTLTWAIADYSAVNDFTAFNLLFKADTFAPPGSSFCINVTVTPVTGDYNPSNNTLSNCFPVIDSYDPNEKEVYPSGNTDTSVHWLTYTIRFQNTGTAPAVNIRITDTLNSNLDPSTFQLLTFSAKNLTQIFGNAVVFNFPNINLPDSLTSDSLSRGYVQYKIKLKDNLPVGTQIQNTAYIYFDLNPAVVTNTTVNTIYLPTGIAPVSTDLSLQIYPNPAKNYIIVETDQNAIGGMLKISDVTGRQISEQQITNTKFRISTASLSNGVYFVMVNDMNGRNGVARFVKE